MESARRLPLGDQGDHGSLIGPAPVRRDVVRHKAKAGARSPHSRTLGPARQLCHIIMFTFGCKHYMTHWDAIEHAAAARERSHHRAWRHPRWPD